ncbi:hypothetical protein JCM11641_000841, partial [Rhodosporidiobolus odoratus]
EDPFLQEARRAVNQDWERMSGRGRGSEGFGVEDHLREEEEEEEEEERRVRGVVEGWMSGGDQGQGQMEVMERGRMREEEMEQDEEEDGTGARLTPMTRAVQRDDRGGW